MSINGSDNSSTIATYHFNHHDKCMHVCCESLFVHVYVYTV
uniref:Uncharacterized protein n=1 Tax=Nelumbo nucifera TaxID=4432 RepID=A0A822YBW6_NELNU|nr:TPA_asm: hypothetical protein HUJ06_030034 [Nelumbo nucifera]